MSTSRRPWRDSFENILVAIFLALLVRTYILTGYKVPTGSMAPTLLPGDFIFAFRPPAGFKVPLTGKKIGTQMPSPGELIVFTFPEQPRTTYVKRVIAVADDKVQMIAGELWVNDQPFQYQKLEQSAVTELPSYDQYEVWRESKDGQEREIIRKRAESGKDFGPVTVPPGEVFVLGDHRDASDDSRYWGSVPLDRIEGRVVMVWLSLDWEHRWAGNRFPSLRTDRLFHSVH